MPIRSALAEMITFSHVSTPLVCYRCDSDTVHFTREWTSPICLDCSNYCLVDAFAEWRVPSNGPMGTYKLECGVLYVIPTC